VEQPPLIHSPLGTGRGGPPTGVKERTILQNSKTERGCRLARYHAAIQIIRCTT
jgi:hypothetical protein